MGRIFYLMGKSASGKDTVYKRLLEEYPKLCPLVLYTTRPMRDGETQGVEYHFVSQEKLENFKKQGKVIESRVYDTVAGPWSYATIDDGMMSKGNQDYVAIGTLESYKKVRDYFGRNLVIPVYIAIEDGLRLERALKRERQQKKPNYQEMCRRFLADEEDFSLEKLKQCGIEKVYENENLENCMEEIRKII
ncbi:MAG: guanylate kinase [Lachnospiraceae bacterium]|nr:guanylate kinase [Lachnospiraceae bacterium]